MTKLEKTLQAIEKANKETEKQRNKQKRKREAAALEAKDKKQRQIAQEKRFQNIAKVFVEKG